MSSFTLSVVFMLWFNFILGDVETFLKGNVNYFVNYVNDINDMYLVVLDYNVFVHGLVISMYIVLYVLYGIVIKIFDGVHLALHRL